MTRVVPTAAQLLFTNTFNPPHHAGAVAESPEFGREVSSLSGLIKLDEFVGLQEEAFNIEENTPTKMPTPGPRQSSKTSKMSKSASPSPLVPSVTCAEGYFCLQNRDYGVKVPLKYNIDILLEVVDEKHADAFVDARAKWMGVVTGDLEDVPSSEIFPDEYFSCTNHPPTILDDLLVCGQDAEIDGPGDGTSNVLGFASPYWTRQDDVTGKVTTITGQMVFDIYDIDEMIKLGTWNGVILHEMGHVLGIGTLWDFNNIVDDNLNYLGGNAINVWKDDWGCVTNAPPVEKDYGPGTAGGHWDEECLVDELMTGFLRTGQTAYPLSKLTVASLEEIGYTVDYSAADKYDGRNTSSTSGCCLPPSGTLQGASMENLMPPSSSAARANAIAYGRQILKENTLPSSIAAVEHDGMRYVGDRVVSVLYAENGHVYEVTVTHE